MFSLYIFPWNNLSMSFKKRFYFNIGVKYNFFFHISKSAKLAMMNIVVKSHI